MEDLLRHLSKKWLYPCLAVVVLFLAFPNGGAPKPDLSDEAAKWADETLAGLTLEKKIVQMICTDISGSYITEEDPRLKRWVRLAGEYGVGGFVLYGGTPRDVAHLLNRLQREAELPILMSEAAKVGAIEDRAMGFHLTYTPVVDISVRPDNPAESVRSFGGDLEMLGRMVRA